jgi:dihydrofolate synthase/folylpolyglutamate synthase
MNYSETLNYIYERLPLFQMVGASAYKAGIESMQAFDDYLGRPHWSFPTIHVGGTNGKGSTAHTIASVLQASGYKTGLFTSPHLKDFRERIRVNGVPASKKFVVEFVEKHKAMFDTLSLSFFEVNVGMAFEYFKQEKVDVAVIEVGLGGRLDSTNIITPKLSVITNISFDHTNILGNTLSAITKEKAGIIKPGIPVVIGEAEGEIRQIFEEKAEEKGSSIFFAESSPSRYLGLETINGIPVQSFSIEGNIIRTPLLGIYQKKNMVTAWLAAKILQSIGFKFTNESIQEGFLRIIELTGLQGRWQKLQENPTIICDTGHNAAGISYVTEQLKNTPHEILRMVIGTVNDKDIDHILPLLPKVAVYYFTKASIPRALPENILKEKAGKFGLYGKSYPSVSEALKAAKEEASPKDLIFVGGSTFVVAEVEESVKARKVESAKG